MFWKKRISYYTRKEKAGILLSVLVILLCVAVVFACWLKMTKTYRVHQLSISIEKDEDVDGITGAEIKEKLRAWKPDDSYAYLIATEALLVDRTTAESDYLKYTTTNTMLVDEMEGDSGTTYQMLYVNYGNVLADNVLTQSQTEESYVARQHCLSEDVTVTYFNEEKNANVTYIKQKKCNAWIEEESLVIEDGDKFKEAAILDMDGKRIGTVYSPVQLNDTYIVKNNISGYPDLDSVYGYDNVYIHVFQKEKVVWERKDRKKVAVHL